MKIVGIISVFNESDIIEEVIKFHLSQGLELVVLDNGSDDDTFEICKRCQRKGHVKLIRSFENPYESNLPRRVLWDSTITLSPDWIIKIDADEFLESGQNDLTLRDGISLADERGFNIIQFDRFDFFMTDDDNDSGNSIKNRLKHYSYVDDFHFNAFKFIPGTLGEEVSHFPIFQRGTQYKFFPKKFVLRHYPFRSNYQAEKKMKDRVEKLGNRLQPTGNHCHYFNILKHNFSKSIDHKLLCKYNEDNQWSYERRFSYEPIQPKREEIFSEGGFLLAEYIDTLNYQDLLKKKNEKIMKLL